MPSILANLQLVSTEKIAILWTLGADVATTYVATVETSSQNASKDQKIKRILACLFLKLRIFQPSGEGK